MCGQNLDCISRFRKLFHKYVGNTTPDRVHFDYYMQRRCLEDGQIAKLLLVAGDGPAALGDELLGALVNLGLGSGNLVLPCRLARDSLPTPLIHIHVYTYNSEVGEWPGVLDVLERLLEVAQFLVDYGLGLLGALDGLGLESLNGLDLPSYIVCLGLEGLELLLDVVDDGLVLEDAAVVAEVDVGRLLGENSQLAARIVVALLEGLEGGGGLTLEAELGSELRPVELEGCAAL